MDGQKQQTNRHIFKLLVVNTPKKGSFYICTLRVLEKIGNDKAAT
jgi:hypothetical protein